LLKRDLRQTRRNLYRYIIVIDVDYFQCEHDIFCYALTQEGIPVDTGYPAMNRYELFQPGFDFDKMSFPVTERASERESVWMGESIFRAEKKGIDDLVVGVQKLANNQDELAKLREIKTRMAETIGHVDLNRLKEFI